MKRAPAIRQAYHVQCSVGSCVTLLLLILDVSRASGATVPMRIVKQASGFDGAFAVHGQQHRQQAGRATPRPFAGPEHLRPLLGRCFGRTAAGYRYTLCPFDNVTQAEESARWNAYSGVLGVWQGWSATNASLSSMHYGDGDSCGTLNRSVEVQLTCGHPRTSLVNAAVEPGRQSAVLRRNHAKGPRCRVGADPVGVRPRQSTASTGSAARLCQPGRPVSQGL
ncbi:hypothetical protein MRX96_031185 [Rhipicephalus microplus]